MSTLVDPRATVPASPRGSRGRAAAHRSGPTTRRPGALAVRLALLAGAVAVTALWWSGTPASVGGTPGGALTSLGELAGLLASFLVCAQLLLVGRVPWFERSVGLDRLVSWHRTLGATVLLLVLTHVALMVIGGAMLDQQALWPEALSLLTTQPEMLSALVGTALFLVVGASSARLLRRRLSYEAWFLVHLTIYAGIYLTFGHQIAAGTHFVADPWARAAWIALYVATGAALLTWRVLVPLVEHRGLLLRVEQVVPEAPGTVSVWLRATGRRQPRAAGGQFVLLRFLTPGHLATAHPYSLSAVPADGLLRVTVAALGDHSAAAAALRPGTRVLMEGPFGRFTADRSRTGRALLVAGGAGIGPVRALAQDLLGRGVDVVVLHRAHDAAGLALAGELAAMPGLRYVPLPGRRADLGADPLAPDALRRQVPDIAGRDVFVCGPEGLMTAVVRAVRALGVPRSSVHHEELSLS